MRIIYQPKFRPIGDMLNLTISDAEFLVTTCLRGAIGYPLRMIIVQEGAYSHWTTP